jgi:nucleotide-binding universal stress UspA family protein
MGSTVFVGFQKILVAFDGSPHAEHALNVAFSIAGDTKATLHVLSVIRPPEPAESAELHAVLDDEHDRFDRCFGPMRDRAMEKEIELETEIAVGHPAEQIIHVADKMQASVIVMGKRSHTKLHRWMLGSNTERVLKYAHCPVMIVHQRGMRLALNIAHPLDENTGRRAMAAPAFVISFGAAQVSLQRSALGPGKRNHYV